MTKVFMICACGCGEEFWVDKDRLDDPLTKFFTTACESRVREREKVAYAGRHLWSDHHSLDQMISPARRRYDVIKNMLGDIQDLKKDVGELIGFLKFAIPHVDSDSSLEFEHMQFRLKEHEKRVRIENE